MSILTALQDKPYANQTWIEDGPVRVSFSYIGEGDNGDYDPDDSEDTPLLRLDVQVRADSGYPGEEPLNENNAGWLNPEDGSICTQVSLYTDNERLEDLLTETASLLRHVVESKGSIRRTMDNLSALHA